MVMKKCGVEVREKSIRLRFTTRDGEVHRRTLDLEPLPGNVKAARKMAAQIEKAISEDTFEMADFFPESADPRSLRSLGKMWVDSKGLLTDATKDQYKTAVRFWENMFGAETNISKLTYPILASKIGKYPWKSAKQYNNYLIALRGIMDLEYHGRRAVENPMAGIENRQAVKKIPDPLTPAERDAVLEYMRENYDVRVWAYFQFAFYTGVRPEELIALRWCDWDRTRRTMHIRRVRTFKSSEREGSKTHTEREIELLPGAEQALLAMIPFTLGKADDIFERPSWAPGPGDRGGRPSPAGPWMNEREQRDRFWKPALAALGIRERRAYATRHTYCTALLMGRVNPAYIAQQAGHSVKMLLDTYARWLPGADDGAERRRAEAAMGLPSDFPEHNQAGNENADKSFEINNLSASDVGRRNWTRTKKLL